MTDIQSKILENYAKISKLVLFPESARIYEIISNLDNFSQSDLEFFLEFFHNLYLEYLETPFSSLEESQYYKQIKRAFYDRLDKNKGIVYRPKLHIDPNPHLSKIHSLVSNRVQFRKPKVREALINWKEWNKNKPYFRELSSIIKATSYPDYQFTEAKIYELMKTFSSALTHYIIALKENQHLVLDFNYYFDLIKEVEMFLLSNLILLSSNQITINEATTKIKELFSIIKSEFIDQ